uniref:DUF1308 domain-containing protein n=1 Tax=Macrostomum lignano TaxID=282301 RepID=A0A1I8FC06_9PLAT
RMATLMKSKSASSSSSLGKDPNLTETEMKQLCLRTAAALESLVPDERDPRALMGGHKLEVQLPERLQQKLVTLAARSADEVTDSAASLRDRDAPDGGRQAGCAWPFSKATKRARLTIRRYGNTRSPAHSSLRTPATCSRRAGAKACVPVRRVNGARRHRHGALEDREDQTAKAGVSYEGGSGELTFSHGEIEKTIDISKKKDEHFKLVLSDCSMGSKLGKISSTIITIVNDDEYSSFISRLAHAANVELDNIRVDKHTYADQFKEAMNVNGATWKRNSFRLYHALSDVCLE